MKIKSIKAEKLGAMTGKATKATLEATTEAIKIASETVIDKDDPIGAKMATFGIAMTAGTVLSMIYVTDGSSFFGLKANLIIGGIFASLVYQLVFSKPKKESAQKEPDFDRLSDKEKKMLSTIQKKADFLKWKASR